MNSLKLMVTSVHGWKQMGPAAFLWIVSAAMDYQHAC